MMGLGSRDEKNSAMANKMKVIMFPWLAHGHISPFLELAKSLVSKTNQFHIYFCSTPVNLTTIKLNDPSLSSHQKFAHSIEFVDLHLPDLPPQYQTTNGLPPNLMPNLKKAFQMAMPNFYQILDRIHPHLLIYDFLQDWAPQAAALLNIPVILFYSTGAATTSFFNYLRAGENPDSFPFQAIYIRDNNEYDKINRITNVTSAGDGDGGDLEDLCPKRSRNIILIRTSRALEAKYIDYLSVLCEKRIVPVGPLINAAPPPPPHQNPNPNPNEKLKREEDAIMNWLDRKPKSSTVFASFGSEYFLSDDEIEEIAHGLELSGVNFIWVVRLPKGERPVCVWEKLPKGFMERTTRDQKGMVVNGWVPQRRILGHGSIGGFMSHCGWGSVLEGVSYGVPMIAAPMHLDQPINSRVLEEMGVGFEVVRRDGESGRFERGEIGRVVREVVSGERGEVMKRKMEEVAAEMRSGEEEDMNGVIRELLSLCQTN